MCAGDIVQFFNLPTDLFICGLTGNSVKSIAIPIKNKIIINNVDIFRSIGVVSEKRSDDGDVGERRSDDGDGGWDGG